MTASRYKKGDRVVRVERLGHGEAAVVREHAGAVIDVGHRGVQIKFDDPRRGEGWVQNNFVKREVIIPGHGNGKVVTKIFGSMPTGAPKIGTPPKVGNQRAAILGRIADEIVDNVPVIMERPHAPSTYAEVEKQTGEIMQNYVAGVNDEIAALQDMAKSLITKAEHLVLEAKKHRERLRQAVLEAQAAFASSEKDVERCERELQRVMQYAGPR